MNWPKLYAKKWKPWGSKHISVNIIIVIRNNDCIITFIAWFLKCKFCCLRNFNFKVISIKYLVFIMTQLIVDAKIKISVGYRYNMFFFCMKWQGVGSHVPCTFCWWLHWDTKCVHHHRILSKRIADRCSTKWWNPTQLGLQVILISYYWFFKKDLVFQQLIANVQVKFEQVMTACKALGTKVIIKFIFI